MKTVVIIVVILILLLPVLIKLKPKPITTARIEAIFKSHGLAEDGVQEGGAALEAVQSWRIPAYEGSIAIYRYENHAKLVKNLEYQKDDPGSRMVAAWNLSESLGAAPPPPPTDTAKKRMYMLVVTSRDAAFRAKVKEAFRAL